MSGKLVFTDYQKHHFAFLIQDNHLTAAQLLPQQESSIGAIYIGKIRRVMQNINAYFVEIANKEMCFLPMKETLSGTSLKEGDELPVQVIREAQKTKQATVTTRLSISNDYAAISIGSARTGYSNKLSNTRKEELIKWLMDEDLINEKGTLRKRSPENGSDDSLPDFGLVIRTRSGECDREVFLNSIKDLLNEFTEMLQVVPHRTCFSCIRKAPEAYEAVFDKLVYPYEYDEIITDDAALYQNLTDYCNKNLSEKKVRFYDDPSFSLTKLYSITSKMEDALSKRVWLKSGGYLYIEYTEALTVIDVNSGKYDARKPSADTVDLINREAACEIARQLRLRNLSGMIIVDFINIADPQKEEELLNLLKSHVRRDKTKTNVVDITPLGLVEITRKKQYKTLREQINEL